MTINRHNYEEFFILYLDNELSSADRRQVDLFVQQHPDLGEELQMLQQTRLDSDPSIVFEGKESLMQLPSLELINSNNYEEWLVQYIDNELNDEQNASVEVYAASNPAAGAALDILLKTKLQPENSITFFNKEILYRREEAPVRGIVPVMWWRVAAAVLLLIALTIGGFTFFKNNSATPDKGIAKTKGTQNVTTPQIAKEKKEDVEEKSSLAQTNPDQSDEIKNSTPKNNNEATFAKKTTNRQENMKTSVENDVPVIAYVGHGKNGNDLPEPTYNPNMAGAPIPTELADTEKPGLTNSLENNSHPLVTSASLTSLKNTENPEEGNEPENKTKFRGLLRKITRTFEKTTNIKATDEQDRLLVAGLSIRL